MAEMSFPWTVAKDTVVVEGVAGSWRVVPHNLPLEMKDTRAEAVARANEIATSFSPNWTVVVKAAPGPFYP